MPAESATALPAAATPPPTTTPATAQPAAAPAAQQPQQQATEAKHTSDIDAILNRGEKKQPTKTDADGKVLEWKTAPKQFREAHERLQTESGARIKVLEDEIKGIKSKSVESPADAGNIAALKKEIEDIRKERTDLQKDRDEARRALAEADYSKHPDFKRDYDDKWHSEYESSVNQALRFQIIVKGAEGEADKARAATQQDFDYIRALPVEARRQAAKELFGENGSDVVDSIKELDRIRRSRKEALTRHAQDHEKTLAEKARTKEGRSTQLEQRKSQVMQAIQAELPELFDAKHYESDPDAKAALEGGYEKARAGLKAIAEYGDESDVGKHAQKLASFEALIASAPLLTLLNTRLTEKNKALEDELSKYRKTDPGAPAGGGQPAAKNEDDIGDVSTESEKFNKFVRR